MRLPIFAQAVGERLDAPIFGLLDRPAESLDDAFQLSGQFIDLLRAGVLAREINVFIERHSCPFLVLWVILSENRFLAFAIIRHCRARPGAKPLEPFGKGSNAKKAGTPDAGPLSVSLPGSRPAVRSAPGRGRAEGGLIRGPCRNARASIGDVASLPS